MAADLHRRCLGIRSLMAIDPLSKLRRFTWVQDFAARLAELGAPASTEVLLELAKDRFEKSAERDAVRAAESVWSEWPTET
jgi:hypothetical protein